jgi:hypothetical protein
MTQELENTIELWKAFDDFSKAIEKEFSWVKKSQETEDDDFEFIIA